MVNSNSKLPWTNNYLFDFIQTALKTTISNLDDVIVNSKNESKIHASITNFWSTWEYLFEKVKEQNIKLLVPVLLLDIGWKEEATHWKALEYRKNLYKEMILTTGHIYPESVINVLSTIGEREFLPEGIRRLARILNTNPKSILYLISPTGERLVKRLFHNHITKIKNDQELVSNYIWLLDTMVDLGSAQAYFLRENVITYRAS